MTVIGQHDADAMRPLPVVMLCLVLTVVAGGSLLLSASKTPVPVDGAIEWHEQSPLRAVVQLLCLNYQVPTRYAGEVKNFILGIGSGLALLSLSIAVIARARVSDDDETENDARVAAKAATGSRGASAPDRAHLGPVAAAQLMVVLYLLWSFASSRWSSAPDLAVQGSILLSVYFFWSFGIGRGLNRRGAGIASRVLVVLAAVTAAVAIWYYYGRNPTLRAKFPFGNPTFLAASLIPGIVLAAAYSCSTVAGAVRLHRYRRLGRLGPVGTGLAVCLWAFYLTGSRGAAVGLVFGLLASVFFALRGRFKWIPIGLALGVMLAGWTYYSQCAESFSPTGRSATLRLRAYAFRYAWNMFAHRPLQGHGQGGYVLAGDSYVVNDVLGDPLVFEARIAHAHNEWLEVLADLGLVGIALLGAALLLTLRAGYAALKTEPPAGDRWILIGLLGALIGLIVEEASGVGLRTAGVPTFFYTVWGLVWAHSRDDEPQGLRRLLATRSRRVAAGAIGGLLALSTLALTRQDFVAARRSELAGPALQEGRFPEAIRLAEFATHRLNPQRTLANLYRVSEAHLRAAVFFQSRAFDRDRRAHENQPASPRPLALAREDYQRSDEHCEKGSVWLKELVMRSPGYMNHGRLAYRFNIVRAQNAVARGDLEQQRALLKDAVVAVRRELERQPFDPALSVDFVRAYLPLAGASWNAREVVDVLARPLRHHRITRPYVDLIRDMLAGPQFEARIMPIVTEARLALTGPQVAGRSPAWLRTWAPEKLRLAATVRFLRGDYKPARDLAELAAPAYDRIATVAPLGAAGCYAELADCRFYADPNRPLSALASADRSLSLAPDSLPGRRLKRSVTSRKVDYYLAAGREEPAKQALRETGPRHATKKALRRELAARYRRLCESLLERHEAGGRLRKPIVALLPKLQEWVHRAIELNPEDPYAFYVAADLAFYAGDDEGAAERLREALRAGLPPDLGVQFLRFARGRRADSHPLNTLWHELVPAGVPSDRGQENHPPPDHKSPGGTPPAPPSGKTSS